MTRMHRQCCDERSHIVPSPLVGEGQGEGWQALSSHQSFHGKHYCSLLRPCGGSLRRGMAADSGFAVTPLPVPPPHIRAFTPVFACYGGRERRGERLRNANKALASGAVS